MLGFGLWHPDGPNNTYFLDLDPITFHHVMAYLRTGTFIADDLSEWEKTQLQYSLDYLNISIPTAEPTEEKHIEWTWDPNAISPGMNLLHDNLVVQAPGYYRWMTAKGNVANPTLFRVRVDSLSTDTYIGLVPANMPQTVGYFLRLKNGQLRGPLGHVPGEYHADGVKSGDILTVRYKDSKIAFLKNDQYLGVAFTVESPNETFFPCVMTFAAAKVTILPPPCPATTVAKPWQHLPPGIQNLLGVWTFDHSRHIFAGIFSMIWRFANIITMTQTIEKAGQSSF
ncbi:hypothetical protein AeMF1_013020 [Aphanomyces euteiches]|nr:hypothetical protein AeMF1_013020 [Aphanomyces euteiches]